MQDSPLFFCTIPSRSASLFFYRKGLIDMTQKKITYTTLIKLSVSWLLVFFWMVVIFRFSAQNGDQSGGLSTIVLEYIATTFEIQVTPDNSSLLGFLVRKAAHLTVFYMLALFAFHAFWRTFSGTSSAVVTTLQKKSFRPTPSGLYALSLALCFLYASFDELHQYFIPGRTAAFRDILIDCLGSLLALVTIKICTMLIQNRSTLRQKK